MGVGRSGHRTAMQPRARVPRVQPRGDQRRVRSRQPGDVRGPAMTRRGRACSRILGTTGFGERPTLGWGCGRTANPQPGANPGVEVRVCASQGQAFEHPGTASSGHRMRRGPTALRAPRRTGNGLTTRRRDWSGRSGPCPLGFQSPWAWRTHLGGRHLDNNHAFPFVGSESAREIRDASPTAGAHLWRRTPDASVRVTTRRRLGLRNRSDPGRQFRPDPCRLERSHPHLLESHSSPHPRTGSSAS